MEGTGDTDNSPSTIASYIQRALARKNNMIEPSSEHVSSNKLVGNTGSEVEQLTTSLINSFTTFPANNVEPAAEIETGPSELPLKHVKVESAKEKSPATLRKRTDLIRSISQITLKTIKNIVTTLKPPQAVINIVLAYVAVLHKIDIYKALLNTGPKTYATCAKILENTEAVHKVTCDAVKYVDNATEDEKAKLIKIKDKYLAGWDMKPSAFSDKYYSGRTILNFLLCLCGYIEEDNEVGKIRRKDPDSPTRRLIEHKTLKMQESAKKAVNKINGRAKTVSKIYQTTRPKGEEAKKRTDDLIHDLLKVFCEMAIIQNRA